MSIFNFRDRPAATAVAFATTLFAVLAVSDPVQGAGPVITEFMADNNNTLSGAGGSTPDWIEIYNPESTEIDLAGWHLTDNDQDPDQ